MTVNFSHCKPIVQNGTYFQIGFQGTLDNLWINIIICIVILIVFTSLKFHAWGRQHDVFCLYKDNWVCLLYRDAFDFIPVYELTQMECTHKRLNKNMTFAEMMWFSVFKLTIEDIAARCGVDAVQYLNFLKWNIAYNVFNTLTALLVILPTNLQGTLRSDEDFFVKSMLDNLDTKQEWAFWIHFLCGVCLVILCLYTIRIFSAGLYAAKRSKWAKRTVLVKDSSRLPLTSETVENYLMKILPDEEIEDIKIVYKYKELILLNRKLEAAEEALTNCQYIQDVEQRDVIVNKLGRWFCCACACARCQVDGIEYYSAKIKEYENKVATQLTVLPLRVFRIAYVTFRSKDSAKKARARKSQYPKEHDDKYWKIFKAEAPNNIDWVSLTRRGSNFTLRTLVVNTTVFVIAVFLTTPTILYSGVHMHYTEEKVSTQNRIFRYIPIFMTWVFSALISLLVTYSSGFLDFETKSGRNRSIMVKTFFFLLFVVVILPTLGLTSIGTFLMWSFMKREEAEVVWRCLFLPGNGYFFVSYILTTAFVGNVIQILLLPALLWIVFSVLLSKSEAEKTVIRKSCIWEFMFGVQYAYGLLIYCLIMFYTSMIPFIAPVGLIYFMTKFAVDRYNVYFTCMPSQASNKLHILAIHFMMFALASKPVSLLFFFYTRMGWSLLTYACLIVLALIVLIWFISMNPCNLDFIPKILLMPHKESPQIPPDYTEDDHEAEREVYQPIDFRKYVPDIPPDYFDKYGNLLYIGDLERNGDQTHSEEENGDEIV